MEGTTGIIAAVLITTCSIVFVCGKITWTNPTSAGVLDPASVPEDLVGNLGITITAEFLPESEATTDAYTIFEQDVTGMFTLTKQSSDYVLKLADNYKLNFENQTTYKFVLKATGDDTPATTSTISCTLSITDVNEPPLFSVEDFSFSVIEGSGENTDVGTVTATDPDTTAPNNVVTYRITDGNVDNVFTVSDAGKITVATGKTVPVKNDSPYVLTLTATSGGTGAGLTVTTKIRIWVCAKSTAKSTAMFPSGSGSALIAAIFLCFLFNIL